MAAADAPPSYTEATKDGPPAYTALFPVNEMKEAKENSSSKGVMAAKICQLCCGSFACLCCLLLLAALPLAMLVIGSVHINDCPGQYRIPIWLVVFGAVSLVHTLISVFKFCAKIVTKKTEEEGETRNQNYASRSGTTCESLLSFFLFIWTIVGSFWVFNYYVYTWSRHGCSNNYDDTVCQCHPVVFLFSYITLIVMYSLSLLICCCGCCCFICCAVFAGASSRDEE